VGLFAFYNPVRPNIGRWIRFGAGILMLTLGSPPAPAQFGAAGRNALAAAKADPASLVQIVQDSGADRAARTTAALALLQSAPGTPQLSTLATLLNDPAAAGPTKAIILDAIARSAATPPALFEAVAVLARSAGNQDLPHILPALGSFRTRDSARLLLDLASPDRPEEVSAAAFDALARLSGRDDLGEDFAAWKVWLDASAILSEVDWRAQVARDQARRADRLAAELTQTEQALTPIYRRLYGQISAVDRPRLLAEMLLDQQEDLRSLGFQLAALELSSGQSLPQVVSDAALVLLKSPSPRTRARAAHLLDEIARDSVKDAISEALNVETDPMAAVALLAAAARWPSPVSRASVLGWLENGPATREPAAKAALALVRAGMLSSESERQRAADALRRVPLEDLGGVELRLLASIGSPEDRERIAKLLDSPSRESRLAAADALASRPEFIPNLLAAAGKDGDLFSVAVEAVVTAGPTAGHFAAVSALPSPNQQARTAGLLRIAGRMTPVDLLAITEQVDDPSWAASLLEPVEDLAPAADAKSAAAVASAILRLADLRLQLGQPDRAASALDLFDALQSRFPRLDHEGAHNLRTTAYLCLDRVDRASAEQGSSRAWIRALQLSKDQPHARGLIEQINARFGGMLSSDEAMELALLETQVAAREAEEQLRLVGPPTPPSDDSR
jgi:hypothetical protein